MVEVMVADFRAQHSNDQDLLADEFLSDIGTIVGLRQLAAMHAMDMLQDAIVAIALNEYRRLLNLDPEVAEFVKSRSSA